MHSDTFILLCLTFPLFATSVPILNTHTHTHSGAHTVTLGTYSSFAQYGRGVARLLWAVINMHSGSVCLVDVLSVCPLPPSVHLSPSVSFLSSCLLISFCHLACHLPSASPPSCLCDSCFFPFVSTPLSVCLPLLPSLVSSLPVSRQVSDLWVNPPSSHLTSPPLLPALPFPLLPLHPVSPPHVSSSRLLLLLLFPLVLVVPSLLSLTPFLISSPLILSSPLFSLSLIHPSSVVLLIPVHSSSLLIL